MEAWIRVIFATAAVRFISGVRRGRGATSLSFRRGPGGAADDLRVEAATGLMVGVGRERPAPNKQNGRPRVSNDCLEQEMA